MNGIAACDIRRAKVPRLGVSLKTKSEREAERRHAAILVLYDLGKTAMIEQVRSGLLSVERVADMVEKREALEPLTFTPPTDPHSWGTVSEQVVKYIEWMTKHPRREEGTTRNAAHQLSKFEQYVYQGQRVGDLLLVDVTTDCIQDYQQSMVTAGRPLNVITTYMSRVGSLWRYVAADEAKEARNQKRPAHELYSPVDPEMLIRDVTRRERFLSESEIERLFMATPEPMLWPVACGVMAGLRMEEVLHLRPAIDVDVILGTIQVQPRDQWKPKTKRSKRTVPMTDALRSIAIKQLERASESWMMPSAVNPDRPLQSDGIRKHFQLIVERAGMIYGLKPRNGVVFHTLRHTFASHLAMRGVDLYTIAQLLGDSLQTTEGVYAKLSPDFKKAAIAKLGPVFKLPDDSPQTVTQSDNQNAN